MDNQPMIGRDRKEKIFLLVFLIGASLSVRIYALFHMCGERLPFGESLWRGWMAKELFEGAGLASIFNTPYQSCEGGSAIIGYMAAFFFLLFGDNFFSLTLVPILVSVFIMAVFYLFLSRHFNRDAAIVFSFLFIFPKVHVLRFSLLALGYHFEAILFSISALWCLFEVFYMHENYMAYFEKRQSKRVLRLFCFLGLISGLGIYVSYDYLIMLFIVMLVWSFEDRSFFSRKSFSLFLIGLVSGILPWLLYNSTHQFNGVRIQGVPLSRILFSGTLRSFVERIDFAVSDLLPGQFGRPLFLMCVVSIILLIALNAKAARHRFSPREKYLPNIKQSILIGYILVFIIIWCIPDLKQDKYMLWGRMMPLYPFLVLTGVALWFEGIIAIKVNNRVAISLPPFLLAIFVIYVGLCNHWQVLSSRSWNLNPLKIKGFSVRQNYSKSLQSQTRFISCDLARSVAASRKDTCLQQFVCGTADSSFFKHSLFYDDPWQISSVSVNTCHLPYPYYCLYLGLNTGDLMEGYDMSSLNETIKTRVPQGYRHYVYEGICLSLMNRRSREVLENVDFIHTVPAQYRHYYLIELGRIIGKQFKGRMRDGQLHQAVRSFSATATPYLYYGLISQWIMSGEYKKMDIIHNVKKSYHPYFYRAIARSVFGQLPKASAILANMEKLGIDASDREEDQQYYYCGVIEAFFHNGQSYVERVIRQKIETLVTCPWMNKDVYYRGVGLAIGHLAFGHIDAYVDTVHSMLTDTQVPFFYEGYCLSLNERYGEDLRTVDGMIETYVPEHYRADCRRFIAATSPT